MLKMILSLSVTLLLFSLIGLHYAVQGSGEYVVSVLAAAINVLMIASVIVILFLRKKKNAV